MTDEHPVFLAGCYGHPVARTPAIDRLAHEGAVFDSAYCASPLCAPCRAAMMTSRHVHEIETWDNCHPLRSDWPTFAHAFRAAGYRTILCGKMHFVGPDQLHGFDERWTPDIYPATFEWVRPHRHGVPVNDGGQHARSVLAAGTGRTEDFDYDQLVMDRALAGLGRLLEEESEQPFLLLISLTGPHYPFVCPEKYWDLYPDDQIDLPVLPPDFQTRESNYLRELRRACGCEEPVPNETCRQARRAILGRVTLVDDHLQQVLNTLGACLDDTIVSYVSDHGDHLGEHGLWFKSSMLEWSARVPWIIRAQGVSPTRLGETVSLLDFGPTLAGLAGVGWLDVPRAGRDLSDLLAGRREPELGRAVMEYYGQGVSRGVRALVRGRRKLVVQNRHETELYDLESDPGEWNNLANAPAWTNVRKSMEAELYASWPDPDVLDEARWQAEERCQAIVRACGQTLLPWQPDWRHLRSSQAAQ